LIVFVVVIVEVPLTSILTVFLIQINCMPGNHVLLGFYMLLHCVLFHNDDDPDSYSKLCRCSVCIQCVGLGPWSVLLSGFQGRILLVPLVVLSPLLVDSGLVSPGLVSP
jgi:hypothetical protein